MTTRRLDSSIEDLLPAFFRRRWSDLPLLRTALQDSDWATIKKLGHQWKGVGTSYGLPEITEFGQRIEACVPNEDGAAVSALLDEFETWLASLRVEFSGGKIVDVTRFADPA